MADGEIKELSELEQLRKQVAAIEVEEKARAADEELTALRVRVKKEALRKALEAKGRRAGRDFTIVDGEDGAFFVVNKPDAVVWMAFSKIDPKTQPDWEALYRKCIDVSEDPHAYERAMKQVEDFPLGTEDRIVRAIYAMLGGAREVRLKR